MTTEPRPLPTTIVALVERRGRATPDDLAIVEADRRISYGELRTLVMRFAEALRINDVRTGERVGLSLGRGAEFVVAALAVWWIGAAFVPLDPSDPPRRRSWLCMVADVRLLVVSSVEHADTDASIVIPTITSVGADENIGQHPSDRPHAASPADLAYVIFTSGSTGSPRGVCVEHAQVCWFATHHAAGVTRPDDVVISMCPTTFDVSVYELWGSLVAGALVVFPTSFGSALDPRALSRLVADHGVTRIWLPPAALNAMAGDADLRLDGVRHVITGGERPSAVHCRTLLRQVGDGTTLWNAYGTTESTGWSMLFSATSPEQIPDRVPAGDPLPGMTVELRDSAGQLVSGPGSGEVWLAGPGVARGYLAEPELTQERFRETESGRTFRTGDLGERDERGRLRIVGRLDDQVQLHGVRLEPTEVEEVLDGSDQIVQSVVAVRPDANGLHILIAYLVPALGAELTTEARTQHLEHCRRHFTRHAEQSSTDVAFNTAGWPGPHEQTPSNDEVRASILGTLSQLPKSCDSILEIGVGHGLLLWRLAPRCKRYVGVDVVIAPQLRREVSRAFDHIELVEGDALAAHSMSALGADLVVLHRVVECFPDEDYLADVLDACVEATVPKGVLFVGGVLPSEAPAAHPRGFGVDVAWFRRWAQHPRIRSVEMVPCSEGTTAGAVGRYDMRFVVGENSGSHRAASAANRASAAFGESRQREIVDAVHRRASSHLPPALVPRSYAVVEELPVTAHGKVDRASLPHAILHHPVPQLDTGRGPEGATEMLVASVLAEVMSVDSIGVDGHFFRDLGGDSLRASRVVALLGERARRGLTVADVFAHPTARELAVILDALQAESTTAEGAEGWNR